MIVTTLLFINLIVSLATLFQIFENHCTKKSNHVNENHFPKECLAEPPSNTVPQLKEDILEEEIKVAISKFNIERIKKGLSA